MKSIKIMRETIKFNQFNVECLEETTIEIKSYTEYSVSIQIRTHFVVIRFISEQSQPVLTFIFALTNINNNKNDFNLQNLTTSLSDFPEILLYLCHSLFHSGKIY